MSDVSVHTRRMTEKGAGQAKSTFDKAATATSEGTRRAEQNALTAVNGMRECYIRMLDMAQDNTVAAFELARDLATVQTPSEFVEVCNARGSRGVHGLLGADKRNVRAGSEGSD